MNDRIDKALAKLAEDDATDEPRLENVDSVTDDTALVWPMTDDGEYIEEGDGAEWTGDNAGEGGTDEDLEEAIPGPAQVAQGGHSPSEATMVAENLGNAEKALAEVRKLVTSTSRRLRASQNALATVDPGSVNRNCACSADTAYRGLMDAQRALTSATAGMMEVQTQLRRKRS